MSDSNFYGCLQNVRAEDCLADVRIVPGYYVEEGTITSKESRDSCSFFLPHSSLPPKKL